MTNALPVIAFIQQLHVASQEINYVTILSFPACPDRLVNQYVKGKSG